MLSSGAELSHCEQRGNQSLFTNQLSSVPGWREDTKPVWWTDVYTHTKHSHQDPLAPSSSFFPLQSSTTRTQSNVLVNNHVFFGCVCVRVCVKERLWLHSQPAGSGLCGNPWQCDFIISHKSARQEPSQPRHERTRSSLPPPQLHPQVQLQSSTNLQHP